MAAADFTVFFSENDLKTLSNLELVNKFFDFEAITTDSEIVQVKSKNGEILDLDKAVSLNQDTKNIINEVMISLANTQRKNFQMATKLQNKDEILASNGKSAFLLHQLCFDDKVVGCGDSKEKLENLLAERKRCLDELRLAHKNCTNDVRKVKLANIITFEVRNHHILSDLINAEIPSEEFRNFFRYSFEDQVLKCNVGDFTVEYGFETYSDHRHLVQTPLTNFVYREISKAFHDNGTVFGALGPAGTGKTESCKDFAQLIGKHAIVFNCSDQMDGQVFLEKVFPNKGSCVLIFDEANRLPKEDLEKMFNHDMLSATHITCNPGYAGRVEIPDEIKQKMQPVGFQVPDFEDIIEVMLVLAGHDNARKKSNQMMYFMKALRVTMSKQHHYDFGMRMIKRITNFSAAMDLDKAVHTAMLAHIVDKDVQIYKKLAKSHFGSEPEIMSVEEKIKSVVKSHAIGIMGPGRDVLLAEIEKTANNLGKVFIKCELSDFEDNLRKQKTETWFLMEYPKTKTAAAVEMMNSVMDDNKKLCLDSGEIIKLGNSKVILTGENANELSPATVSRMAIAWN